VSTSKLIHYISCWLLFIYLFIYLHFIFTDSRYIATTFNCLA
jgi:hypothetical protein